MDFDSGVGHGGGRRQETRELRRRDTTHEINASST